MIFLSSPLTISWSWLARSFPILFSEPPLLYLSNDRCLFWSCDCSGDLLLLSPDEWCLSLFGLLCRSRLPDLTYTKKKCQWSLSNSIKNKVNLSQYCYKIPQSKLFQNTSGNNITKSLVKNYYKIPQSTIQQRLSTINVTMYLSQWKHLLVRNGSAILMFRWRSKRSYAKLK